MAKLEDLVNVDPDYIVCKQCGGMVRYRGSGKHICEDCGAVYLDDFGKVKEFLEKRGPSNIVEIAAGTGLTRGGVNKLLREGRIQVADNSRVQLLCEACGTPIKFGTYCEKCLHVINGESRLKGVYKGIEDDESGEKMRFIKKQE